MNNAHTQTRTSSLFLETFFILKDWAHIFGVFLSVHFFFSIPVLLHNRSDGHSAGHKALSHQWAAKEVGRCTGINEAAPAAVLTLTLCLTALWSPPHLPHCSTPKISTCIQIKVFPRTVRMCASSRKKSGRQQLIAAVPLPTCWAGQCLSS